MVQLLAQVGAGLVVLADAPARQPGVLTEHQHLSVSAIGRHTLQELGLQQQTTLQQYKHAGAAATAATASLLPSQVPRHKPHSITSSAVTC